MAIQTRRTTAEDLLNMPDDGHRYELVGGELRRMAPAGGQHGYLASKIGRLLGNHAEASGLGRVYAAETGFLISQDPDTVRAPDAAFVGRARLDETGEPSGYRPGAPDLAVEVVSPNDRHSEVVEKALAWLDAGCRMVLVADPERRAITVYRSREEIRILVEGDAVDGADVVPGWALPVAEIFA